MSTHENSNNQPFAVLPTNIQMTMTEAGFANQVSSWNNMEFILVDPNDGSTSSRDIGWRKLLTLSLKAGR